VATITPKCNQRILQGKGKAVELIKDDQILVFDIGIIQSAYWSAFKVEFLLGKDPG